MSKMVNFNCECVKKVCLKKGLLYSKAGELIGVSPNYFMVAGKRGKVNNSVLAKWFEYARRIPDIPVNAKEPEQMSLVFVDTNEDKHKQNIDTDTVVDRFRDNHNFIKEFTPEKILEAKLMIEKIGVDKIFELSRQIVFEKNTYCVERSE